MSDTKLPATRWDDLFYTTSDTRLVDDITWELRMSLGFTIRDVLRTLEDTSKGDRSGYAVNVARSCTCGSHACRTHLASLTPLLLGDIGAHRFDEGVGDSILAFALSDTLMLAPDLGQLIIRNCMDWPDGQPVYGPISARRLARGIVDRRWSEGNDPEPVMQFALDLVMVPLEDLRQQLVLRR